MEFGDLWTHGDDVSDDSALGNGAAKKQIFIILTTLALHFKHRKVAKF